MTIITEHAPAKINLTLEVLGRRPDGYHELQSLVAFARDAADVMSLDVSRPVGSEVAGPFGATIAGQNLIDVTLAKLAAAEPSLRLGHVVLTKNLPVAAGIGGGSADAAAVLRCVRRANPDRAEGVDWHAIAASLGADVPVCFENRASWMTGVGEILSPVSELPALSAVLVNPLQEMPADKTVQVFRRLNAPPLQCSPVVKNAVSTSFANANALITFMAEHGNSLERPAREVAPVIAEILALTRGINGDRDAAVSGGGPTCFAIFELADTANFYRSGWAAMHPNWWIVQTTLD